MKKTLLTASLLATGLFSLCAGSASAREWVGAYVGGSLTSAGAGNKGEALTFDTNIDGQYGDTVKTFSGGDYFAFGFCRGTANGPAAASGCRKKRGQGGVGLRVGSDWQSGDIVYGVVAEITGGKLEDSVSGFSTAPDSYTFTRKIDSLTALRARIGRPVADWLVYGTAGFAWAKIDRTFTTTNAFNSFAATRGKNGTGYQVGLGIEKKYGERWLIGLEYLHTSLKDRGASVRAGPSASTFASNPFLIANASGTDIQRSSDRFKNDAIAVTVAYRFGAS